MRLRFLLLLGAALLGVARPDVARAMPTGAPLWGITGTGTLPNSRTVAPRNFEAGLSFENVEPRAGGDVRFFPIGTLTYGLRRGEVGVGILRERVEDAFLGQSFSSTYSTVHGKYRVYENPRSRVQAAVGAHFLDFGRVEGNATSLYAVGSKVLSRPRARTSVTGNVGLLSNRIRGDIDDNNIRPFVSLEGARGVYSLAIDYVPSSGESVQIYSGVARYEKERLGVQLGYGQFRGSDEKLFASASYRFGTR